MNKYSSKEPISCSSSCLPFVGVRMVSPLYGYVCYYLMQSIGLCANFLFFYLITKLFPPRSIGLLNSGHFPPYTIIPTYTIIWNVRVMHQNP